MPNAKCQMPNAKCQMPMAYGLRIWAGQDSGLTAEDGSSMPVLFLHFAFCILHFALSIEH
jgi:hypothetical protein